MIPQSYDKGFAKESPNGIKWEGYDLLVFVFLCVMKWENQK